MIVDAPATGHGIGFLQTPRTFAGIARVGPIHSQAQELDRFITDHDSTGVAIVSLPEEMPVNESASLEDSLADDIGMAVDRIYMNALYPERFSKSDASELERALDEADGPAKAAVRAALSEFRRSRSQRDQLQRLKKSVSSPVKTLPFIFKPAARRPLARAALRSSRLMPSIDEIVEGRGICICAGSGGVGKTTTSAAMAAGPGGSRARRWPCSRSTPPSGWPTLWA